MAKEDSHLEKLGAVLDKSLKRLQLSARLDEYSIWPIWTEVVGPTIARNAQPERIRNGTLLVKVTSPVWMQQLQYMKDMIAEKINQRARTDAVKNIFFVVGNVAGETKAEETLSEPKNPHPSPPLESKANEELLQSISDPEIREAFKRLLKSHSRRKRKD